MRRAPTGHGPTYHAAPSRRLPFSVILPIRSPTSPSHRLSSSSPRLRLQPHHRAQPSNPTTAGSRRCVGGDAGRRRLQPGSLHRPPAASPPEAHPRPVRSSHFHPLEGLASFRLHVLIWFMWLPLVNSAGLGRRMLWQEEEARP